MCIALRHETLEAHAIVDAALELSDKPGHQHGAWKTPHWRLARCSQPIRDVDLLHALIDRLFGQMESAGLRSAACSPSRSRVTWSCRKVVAHVSVLTGCFIPVALKMTAPGRYSVSSISQWKPQKGGHQGASGVRSFSLTARRAVRLSDSCVWRGAVNDRRQ